MHVETLVRMSQQIATNNRALPPDEAVAKVAGHLRSFWTPAMCRELAAYAAFNASELDPTVLAALDLLGEREGG